MEEIKKDQMDSKKIKNLISIVILLAGLFVGSLFVDVAQVIRGSGYSAKNLNKADIFESEGKTWVAFTEPAVEVKVINDESCENCDPSEALIWLRRMMPTISAQKVSFDSEEGQKIIADFNLKTLPAFVFSDKITETDFYSQAQPIFEKGETGYFLRAQELGMTPGKYLASPEIKEGDFIKGNKDAKVKVVIFSDFQCPYCEKFHTALRETMKNNQENVVFDFKNLPLDIHPQAGNAALAAACAQEQNKFWEYADRLFERQADWANTEGTYKFKEYAGALGLNYGKFSQCLDSKKYMEKIKSDMTEANELGISGTPAVFVNSQFKNAALEVKQLDEMIKVELNK